MIFSNLFKSPVVNAYWWNAKPNFGDALAPFLLTRFSDIKNIKRETISRSLIISVGSVLEHIPPEWDGYIVGAGKLIKDSRLNGFGLTAKILALRGPLTALGFKGSFALGDPGILANELIEAQEKKWDLGILPHWQDTELAERFTKLIPSQFSCKIISPIDNPLDVIREIASCRRIVTSSLHGMIVADSIGGIPRRVEICKALDKDGGLFKFYDYSASIKTPFEIGKMIEPSRFRIEDIKYEVYDAYRELSSELRKL